MDVVVSAVAADLVGRLIAFLVRKYQEPGAAEDAARLRRALLRAGAVVEEAEGRQIANRAVLLQLDQLRREMCRGAYELDVDALRRRAGDPRKRHATAERRTFSRLRLGTGGGLSAVVESLEAALCDMRELVVLFGCCPRVARQPYSAYLLMESCMFGRQVEKEQIIGFLLQPSQDLDVLPIVGPREVGKRTLVEHVCLDERLDRRHREVLDRGRPRRRRRGRGGRAMEKVPRVRPPPRARGEQDYPHQQGGRARGPGHRAAAPAARAAPGGALVLLPGARVRRRGPGGAPGAAARRHGPVRWHPRPRDVRGGRHNRRIAARRPERAVLAPRAGRVRRGDGPVRGFPVQAGEGLARRPVRVPRQAQVDGRGHGAERAPRRDDAGPGDRRRRAPGPRRRDAVRRAGVAVSHPSVHELRRDVRRWEISAGGGRREEASS
ncbi:hypothetical protein GQ55_5G430100 [Panicum hallii var. hallii]|uniref:Rx N-terminal domain-containing protein n=1 Tax=Panicum hallii var. hallii TaxID=1504633 RepID=A0A2T7DPD1_9POAL|nr:hypothetical protein GQ55_5G430100 [Panicum hallii var. hallii]